MIECCLISWSRMITGLAELLPAWIFWRCGNRSSRTSAAKGDRLSSRFCVLGERVRIESIRTSTDSQGNEARLIARVEHLRDILEWATTLSPPEDADASPMWQTLQTAIEIARKAMAGQDDPQAPGKLRSTVDQDARRGRHGEFYDGYFVDVLIDADSELFTAIDVLPADGNESADALTLLDQEQSAHDNTVEQISIDGAGFDGPVIRELESRGITAFVPPKNRPTVVGLPRRISSSVKTVLMRYVPLVPSLDIDSEMRDVTRLLSALQKPLVKHAR